MTEYRYRALNRRAAVHGAQTNWMYYDLQQPLLEYANNDATPVAIYYNGEVTDQLKAIWRQGKESSGR
jgi:hypothetical protein